MSKALQKSTKLIYANKTVNKTNTAMTITNWLVVRRLVTVCKMVIRAAVVEPDGRKTKERREGGLKSAGYI